MSAEPEKSTDVATSLSKLDNEEKVITHYTERFRLLRESYDSGKTRPISYRIEQLKAIDRFLTDHRQTLQDAVKKDLNKHNFEADLYEIDLVKNDIKTTIMEIQNWAKPVKAKKTLMSIMDQPFIYNEPYGLVIVIGTWNYPIHLLLSPVVGAIAAGNTCVIKPSNVSEHTSKVMDMLVPNYLDEECYLVLQGGRHETSEMLKERFDYIFYTGSISVGKKIYESATKYLTPVTLELGGKSPVIIDDSVKMMIACRRLIWAKLVNAGQTCVAPDYVLCPDAIHDQFVKCCQEAICEFYGGDPIKSDDYGRIVSKKHVRRIARMLEGANIAFGGTVKEEERYVAPTILIDVKPTDAIMQEEIFGPILPIIRLTKTDPIEEAIEFINSREKPLSLYVFSTNRKTVKRIVHDTSSGSVCVNDALLQLMVDSLPFGGVGMSGMGAYHGKHTFDTFSHQKAVLVRDFNPLGEAIAKHRYPPLDSMKLWVMRQVTVKRSWSLRKFLSCLPYVVVFLSGAGTYWLIHHFTKQLNTEKPRDRTTSLKEPPWL